MEKGAPELDASLWKCQEEGLEGCGRKRDVWGADPEDPEDTFNPTKPMCPTQDTFILHELKKMPDILRY